MANHEEILRGRKVINDLSTKHITVCGAGAIGGYLVDAMTRVGFRNFRIIDFDRVEDNNINNQIYDQNDVGQVKVNALRDKMYALGANVEAINKKLEPCHTKKYLKTDTQIIVDAFDNWESRAILDLVGKDMKVPVVHLGIETDFGEVIWDNKYNIPKNSPDTPDACQIPLARSVAVIVATLACELIIDFFTNGKKKSIIYNRKDFKVIVI